MNITIILLCIYFIGTILSVICFPIKRKILSLINIVISILISLPISIASYSFVLIMVVFSTDSSSDLPHGYSTDTILIALILPIISSFIPSLIIKFIIFFIRYYLDYRKKEKAKEKAEAEALLHR